MFWVYYKYVVNLILYEIFFPKQYCDKKNVSKLKTNVDEIRLVII